ncbi:MAG TPA: PASTA domain-containing protein [Terriglobales bacterium]|nr:PASTA domain-containing protein [Terriglobales bacterium]
MKAFFRFVLCSLVLLLVALVSALTAMRFAIHGREVAVPNLVGDTPAEARRISEMAGFGFEVERQYYSPNIPEGRVLSQIPTAGTLIRSGWQIRVALSLGPQRVQIPDVMGESERAAEINILRRGLDVGAVAQVEIPGATPDQVIAQNPAPNASSIAAPKINLLAAEPPLPQAFVMPSLVGQTLSVATAALEEAGLELGNVTSALPPPDPLQPNQPPPAAPPPSGSSLIISQNPAAGAKVIAGSSVSFEVRSGE